MRAIVGILASAVALFITTNASAISTSQKLHRSATVVAWYEGKGHWTLRPHYRKCAQLHSNSAAARCYRHRQNYRWHRARVVRFTPKPLVILDTWLVRAFTCIHGYEGAWNANTGNGYEGGLQFGHSEWQRFGGQYAAHAYEASPAQQIAAGIAYYRLSGFAPWPNTARACGLL